MLEFVSCAPPDEQLRRKLWKVLWIILRYCKICWRKSLEYVKESEIRARIGGVSDRMMKFDFFFGVMLGQTVLSHSDNLST